MALYPEYKQLDLPNIAAEMLKRWEKDKTFEQSVELRDGAEPFVFYEGPPSANGMPGIHHVMARAIKDIFCRYKTLKGYQVKRKGGWDTHGLPIELSVEKTLGISKDDIGKKISVEEYNAACRSEVMKYKDKWDELTRQMGYWVDLEDPYITFDNKYLESVWYLLSQLYKKELLYKGYTIQPYSWAAGTGLSSHELNQPGCYKNIKDTTVVAMFKATAGSLEKLHNKFPAINTDLYFLAWTTTPWTLPSNTALAIGKNINYCLVKTYNPYTYKAATVVLAKDLLGKYFKTEDATLAYDAYKPGDKEIPYQVLGEIKGEELAGLRYEQLLNYAQPVDGDAFRIIVGDFVSTEDGTGIVHIAPSFGADDFRVAKQNGIGSLTLVDKNGKFLDEVKPWAGMLVKVKEEDLKGEKPTDVLIAIKLKEDGKAFRVEKYEHNYPHCWRTDQPIIYYPLDSWFVRTTAAKERMIELNKTINWKPESTGTGRFGNWLENLVDWNLSRSRFWGIPLPIWRSSDQVEEICIGSVAELSAEIDKSVATGFMKSNPYKVHNTNPDYTKFDLHRPFIDDVVLLSSLGKPMYRELDLIDVWFDSGAMPYAQWHYPFEEDAKVNVDLSAPLPPPGNKKDKKFPADFIAEGVDQTRGWFFTLHAIAVMLFDSVAYKNVVSNGLVLDKNGNKMSKRLQNAVDPFETLDKYGADATRWYMVSNAQPWDNLKFNAEGIAEVQRKFFGTLFNTYNFFAIYANIDHFSVDEQNISPIEDRPELDRWIISCLNSLIISVDAAYADYDPTKAARAIEYFLDEQLSNWYVRLSRRRFWKGEMSDDKKSAYETLYECLSVLTQLISPIAPFFADWMYHNLSDSVREEAIANKTILAAESVHLSFLAQVKHQAINKDLEQAMELAQEISSIVLSLRKKVNIRVRQPLSKILIPVNDNQLKDKLSSMKALILAEVNIKDIEFVNDQDGLVIKKVKPNFKSLGKKAGPLMKDLATVIPGLSKAEIQKLEDNGSVEIKVQNATFTLSKEDVEILLEDIPGWTAQSNGKLTVALDISISPELKNEGIARELINRVQNMRKDAGFELTDTISVQIEKHDAINQALANNKSYICGEILAKDIELVEILENASEVALDEEIKTRIKILRN